MLRHLNCTLYSEFLSRLIVEYGKLKYLCWSSVGWVIIESTYMNLSDWIRALITNHGSPSWEFTLILIWYVLSLGKCELCHHVETCHHDVWIPWFHHCTHTVAVHFFLCFNFTPPVSCQKIVVKLPPNSLLNLLCLLSPCWQNSFSLLLWLCVFLFFCFCYVKLSCSLWVINCGCLTVASDMCNIV